MKISEDDFLLFDESEGIDLFGDVGNDNEQSSDDELDIDPELILKSVQEFHNLFASQDEALGIGSGAILLYQIYKPQDIKPMLQSKITMQMSQPAVAIKP